MAKKKMGASELKSKCEAMGIDVSKIPWDKIGGFLSVILELISKYAPKNAKAGCEEDHASLREALTKNAEVGCAIACHLEDCSGAEEDDPNEE